MSRCHLYEATEHELLPERADTPILQCHGTAGGSIVAETAVDLSPTTRAALLEGLLTEDPSGEAFERKEADFIFGTLITLDMGSIFGVRLIRFFPRNTVFPSPPTPFENDYLRNFELRIHDGVQLNEAGAPA